MPTARFPTDQVAARAKGFRFTAAYDRAISARLARVDARRPRLAGGARICAPRALDLRYGENPHQTAALYSERQGGIAGAEQLHGKELSYNNLVDLDAAWQLIQEFDKPAAAIIKHTNPCGCAEEATLAESYRRAFEADPVSAYGGVLAFNRDGGRRDRAEIAKNVRGSDRRAGLHARRAGLLRQEESAAAEGDSAAADEPVVKSISGGYLAQTPDTHRLDAPRVQVKTERAAHR